MPSLYSKIVTYKKECNPFAFEHVLYKKDSRKMESLLSSVPSGAKILDVGCGSGKYWNIRNDLNWIGLDVDSSSRASILINNGDNYPIQSESFDAVIMSFSIEHISNTPHLIQEVYRVLKSKGVLIIRCPFIYPLHDSPDDFYRFSPSGLSANLGNFDMKEININGGFFEAQAVNSNYFLLQTYNKCSLIYPRHFFKLFLFLPFLMITLLNNILSLLLSKLDMTEKFPILHDSIWIKID